MAEARELIAQMGESLKAEVRSLEEVLQMLDQHRQWDRSEIIDYIEIKAGSLRSRANWYEQQARKDAVTT